MFCPKHQGVFIIVLSKIYIAPPGYYFISIASFIIEVTII